jgi:hypothetical protein
MMEFVSIATAFPSLNDARSGAELFTLHTSQLHLGQTAKPHQEAAKAEEQ